MIRRNRYQIVARRAAATARLYATRRRAGVRIPPRAYPRRRVAATQNYRMSYSLPLSRLGTMTNRYALPRRR